MCETVYALWDSGSLPLREALLDEVNLSVGKKSPHRLKLDEIESVADYAHGKEAWWFW